MSPEGEGNLIPMGEGLRYGVRSENVMPATREIFNLTIIQQATGRLLIH